MTRRQRLSAAVLTLAFLVSTAPVSLGSEADTYRNPLAPKIPGDGTVDSCADPTVLHAQQPDDRHWYMYCTTDPLNDGDTAGPDANTFHRIPMMRSLDLVHWTYVGDALPDLPSWASEGAALWAPDVVYSRTFHRYYLTYVVTDVDDRISGEPGCHGDNAIGVATSKSPTGPWHSADTPVVPPRRNGPGCDFFWTFDPDVLGDAVRQSGILYYGSYYGGLYGTHIRVHRDGMSLAGAPTQVAIPNRYEGANVVQHGGRYYLFASATNCCNGPLTGYSVFAGRSSNPLGPFVDRDGNSFLAGRVGGTPVLTMNGNRWVGTGHNSVFRDFDGQWWTVFHAVDRFDPYFADEPGFTRRPALLDPIDWVRGWPTVRAGRSASAEPMPAPAAQPTTHTRYRPVPVEPLRPGRAVWRLSDQFRSGQLADQWSWVREPAGGYELADGHLQWTTQNADLSGDTDNASILTEAAPAEDYVVQTRVRVRMPSEGCCYNYDQAGLVVYRDDDRYVKLVHVAIWETRQTEFAKEVKLSNGTPKYGNTVVGTPSNWTYLRIVRRTVERPNGTSRELYTAYTRQEHRRWVRGGTWTHQLGDHARIGLVSMGAQDGVERFPADFDYVRVWTLADR